MGQFRARIAPFSIIILIDNDFFYLIKKKTIKKYCFYKDKIDFEVDVLNLIRWVVKG